MCKFRKCTCIFRTFRKLIKVGRSDETEVVVRQEFSFIGFSSISKLRGTKVLITVLQKKNVVLVKVIRSVILTF